MAGQFYGELIRAMPKWKWRLGQDPSRLTELGLPLGSGAIESGIRRVINLRLKNNGMFWREKHAEAMLQVRAQIISKRLGRSSGVDAATPSPRWSNQLGMGAPGDEFQNLNADYQWPRMPEKHGEFAMQNGIARLAAYTIGMTFPIEAEQEMGAIWQSFEQSIRFK